MDEGGRRAVAREESSEDVEGLSECNNSKNENES